MTTEEYLLQKRRQLLGHNLSLFYQQPVCLVKGEGVWLWDNHGQRYLDSYNNVPHVGHCHPKVVEALCQQARTLNTHTRYLHPGIVGYAEKLTATLDSSLNSLTLTCTGSEANDLALRIGQAVTGHTGVICSSATYHGNTTAVSQLSASRPPIGGRAANIRQVDPPNELQPIGLDNHQTQAEAFAAQVTTAIDQLQQQRCGFSALVLCPLFANEGFPTLSSGFLDQTVRAVHQAGGVVIADEVQSGFGRTGTHMWAHEKLGFVPDIMTLGKPIANGYPVGAVITQRENLAAFQQHYSYFNTFAGNPVACAAAHATLEVLQEENLMDNARQVGDYARQKMLEIQARYPIIASVRGTGLFFGAELDRSEIGVEQAKILASKIANQMKDNGVLIGISGPYRTLLKMRPPMPFATEHADLLTAALEQALATVVGRQ